jgi:signal transduction histidine kinase
METEGNGLGLFIIRSIIKEHGGEVVIKSEEAKGTEVSFTIPIKKEKSKKGKKGRVEKQKGGK